MKLIDAIRNIGKEEDFDPHIKETCIIWPFHCAPGQERVKITREMLESEDWAWQCRSEDPELLDAVKGICEALEEGEEIHCDTTSGRKGLPH